MPVVPNPDSYYGVNTSPNDPARFAGFPTTPASFNTIPRRFNPLNESISRDTSPYTPMGSLNIPAANGSIPQHGYSTSGRAPAPFPVNLQLPLPLSLQAHGHFSSFNTDGHPSLDATAQFSGPSMATVRSLETEGHLV